MHTRFPCRAPGALNRGRFATLACVLAVFVLLNGSTASAAVLLDIRGHWAEPEIRLMLAKQIIAGYPDGKFLPDNNVSRAEFAKMLTTALGLEQKANDLVSAHSRFKDVRGGDWALGYIETACDLGIVHGYPNGTFHPEAGLSRAEAAAMGLRAIQLLTPNAAEVGAKDGEKDLPAIVHYADEKQFPDWASELILKASKLGLVGGYPDGSFRPDRNVTRAEACKIVVGMLRFLGRDCDIEGKALGIKAEYASEDALEVEIPSTAVVVTVRVAPDCFVLRNGKAETLKSIRAGDQIKAILRPGWEAIYIEATSPGRSVEASSFGAWETICIMTSSLPSG